MIANTFSDLAPQGPLQVSHNLAGQRLGRKGQETRERILTAMLNLLDDPDGPPVTLTGVASEASVGITTLYLYFPDMGDLVLSSLRRVMDSAENAFLSQLRRYWPDEMLGAHSLEFLRAHYRFWKRRARLLHMRNSFADANDERVLEYRTEVSRPVLDLFVAQMGGDPTQTDSMSAHMATVMMVGFERVATLVTNPNFHGATAQVDEARDTYIDKLIVAEARLIELAIRHQRLAEAA